MGATLLNLLGNDNKIVGLVRRTSTNNMGRIENNPYISNVCLESGDITDFSSLDRIIADHKPDYIINTAAASHVGESFKSPLSNLDITGKGCANVLEAMRQNMSEDYQPRFAQMSSSEMFGSNFSYHYSERENKLFSPTDGEISEEHLMHSDSPFPYKKDQQHCFQYEGTPLQANSPYAAAKIYGHNMTELYRKTYGMFCNSMICFNFEGPDRGENFVTRKITRYIGALAEWIDKNYICFGDMSNDVCDVSLIRFSDEFKKDSYYPKLRLGNVESMRDWSHAEDTANAIIMALEHDKPDTYCVCSQNVFTVKDFMERAFSCIGLNYEDMYVVDPEFFRPCEVPFLKGSSNKIRSIGWSPKKDFDQLVYEMVSRDLPTPKFLSYDKKHLSRVGQYVYEKA